MTVISGQSVEVISNPNQKKAVRQGGVPGLDLNHYQLATDLKKARNDLGMAREKLNRLADQYSKAMLAYKKAYATAYMRALTDPELKEKYRSAKDKEIFALEATYFHEVSYRSAEQQLLNQRKIVDSILSEIDILRSLFSRAAKEYDDYHLKNDLPDCVGK